MFSIQIRMFGYGHVKINQTYMQLFAIHMMLKKFKLFSSKKYALFLNMIEDNNYKSLYTSE